MKAIIALLIASAATLAQNVEWNECQSNCLEVGGNSACTIAWNETDCFCSTEQFATDVRHCFYENSCWTDIQPFYEAREARCGDLARDVSFEGRPGASSGNETSSASSSSSAGATSSPASSSAIASATTSEASAGAASSEPATSENAGMALVPTWGSGAVVMGSVASLSVISGGLLLL